MRLLTILVAAVAACAIALTTATAQENGQNDSRPAATPPQTFALETYVLQTYNYLDRMVDKDGLPYFDVFWTDPAEAAHDCPTSAT